MLTVILLIVSISASLARPEWNATSPTYNREIVVYNNCPYGVNAYQGRFGSTPSSRHMNPRDSWTTYAPSGWTQGRVWAEIPGQSTFPNTLAEFAMNQYLDLDFYDISLVDGFNIPMSITARGGQGGNCSPLSCSRNLLASCPQELRLIQNGRV